AAAAASGDGAPWGAVAVEREAGWLAAAGPAPGSVDQAKIAARIEFGSNQDRTGPTGADQSSSRSRQRPLWRP
ncbi:hypothetical protein, partial [Lysobacter enzymogenes]|uniref:hypothetical protein n=1 Tax=Lysobacter enzymogenes TaxID=69 RepID=UPI0019D1B462